MNTEVIELGGGFSPIFHPNLDMQKVIGKVDIISDVRRGLPFITECCNHVYSAHLIEHLFYRDGEAFLKEIWRILKLGGKAEIICPDLEELVEQYKREGLTDRVWGAFCGGHNNCLDVHHAVYDERALRNAMENVGFKIIEVQKKRYNRYGIPELRMVGIKK